MPRDRAIFWKIAKFEGEQTQKEPKERKGEPGTRDGQNFKAAGAGSRPGRAGILCPERDAIGCCGNGDQPSHKRIKRRKERVAGSHGGPVHTSIAEITRGRSKYAAYQHRMRAATGEIHESIAKAAANNFVLDDSLNAQKAS